MFFRDHVHQVSQQGVTIAGPAGGRGESEAGAGEGDEEAC